MPQTAWLYKLFLFTDFFLFLGRNQIGPSKHVGVGRKWPSIIIRLRWSMVSDGRIEVFRIKVEEGKSRF